MTKKERVIAALNHRESDIIPFHIDFTSPEYDIMLRYYQDPHFFEKLDTHLLYQQFSGYPTELSDRPHFFRDGFGVVWNRTIDKDIGIITPPFVCDLENYTRPVMTLDEQRIRQECENLQNDKNEKFVFYGI